MVVIIEHTFGRAHNKASGLTGYLVAMFLMQGLLVHLWPDK